MDKRSFATKLFEAGAIKFGEFRLKTGVLSPVYVDLRVLISYPEIVESVSDQLGGLACDTSKLTCPCELICGVPYTAIPFASCVSVRQRIPMLMRRKEAKAHGTRQMIEGHFQAGQSALIIEDILSSGTSILETVITLKEAGLRVTDALVILDRQQGGHCNLSQLGIKVHSLITITEVLDVLGENGQISSEQKQKSIEWLQSNPVLIHSSLIDQYESIEPVKRIQVECASTKPIIVSGGEKTLLELADTAPHSIQRRLLQLIVEKQSNLCVSIDRTDSESVLDLIRLIGAHVVLIKLHADIITNFDDRFVQELRRLADQLRFLVFEDRKFADIGNTVRLQFSQGLHRIREWADIVNCHALPGAGVLDGIRAGLQDREVACLIVAQLSCKGNLITETYTKQAVAQAEANPDLVIGFISQERLSSNPHILHMTPGVHLDQDGDKLGQQYVTPADAVTQRGADLVIVGRGITESSDPVEAAIRYKQNAYEALEKRFQRISSSN